MSRVSAGILSMVFAPAALLLTSCAMGPNYQRPQVKVPPQFRGAPPAAPTAGRQAASLADLSAFDLFHDATLTALLKTALSQNNDLRIAAERVLEARSQYGITRSGIFPSVDATGQYDAVRSSSVGSFTFVPAGLNLASSYTQAGFSLSWELDVWGRLRRLTESARAQYLASEEARHGVVSTVIADVTTGYLNLLELDSELEVAR
ncbi:MAG: TolC family protein, partial [Bryobacteraceae bacterium]